MNSTRPGFKPIEFDGFRNQTGLNTFKFMGLWESVHNPKFNHGEFAMIRSQVDKTRSCRHLPP